MGHQLSGGVRYTHGTAVENADSISAVDAFFFYFIVAYLQPTYFSISVFTAVPGMYVPSTSMYFKNGFLWVEREIGSSGHTSCTPPVFGRNT